MNGCNRFVAISIVQTCVSFTETISFIPHRCRIWLVTKIKNEFIFIVSFKGNKLNCRRSQVKNNRLSTISND